MSEKQSEELQKQRKLLSDLEGCIEQFNELYIEYIAKLVWLEIQEGFIPTHAEKEKSSAVKSMMAKRFGKNWVSQRRLSRSRKSQKVG